MMDIILILKVARKQGNGQEETPVNDPAESPMVQPNTGEKVIILLFVKCLILNWTS